MSRENELVKNTLILGIGAFLPKLVSLITIPIVTENLTKTEYGTFDMITTVVMLLIPIATLQIPSAAFRFLIECRGDRNKSSEIITNIFIVTIISGLVMTIGIGFFAISLPLSLRVVVSLYFLMETLNLSVLQSVRGLGLNKLYSVSAVIVSLVNGVGVIVALLYTDLGLVGIVIAMFIADTVSVLFQFFGAKLYLSFKIKNISMPQIKKMLSFSWPMIPNNLSNWVLKVSDRLVITTFIGLEANAAYAVANKIPNLLAIAQSVFAMAWQENASIAVKDADASMYYTKMFDKILSFMVGSTALLIGFTPIMFVLLIRGDYSESYIQMPILILGMLFYCMSSFQSGIYIAHKKTKNVGLTTVCAAVINLVIDLVFVNILGITAGSISTLIAYLALYIFRLFNVLTFQKIKYDLRKQLILFFILICQLIICAQRIWFLDSINLIVGVIIFFILNREVLISIVRKLLKKSPKNIK